VEYFESCEKPQSAVLRCSDTNCPCPEVEIPRGTGYLWVSPEVVEFRRSCPTLAQLNRKFQSDTTHVVLGPGVATPILMCEQGARLRGVDMEAAAADARLWWDTGRVPLRPTPKAGTQTGQQPSASAPGARSVPVQRPLADFEVACPRCGKANAKSAGACLYCDACLAPPGKARKR